jgi:hypothetical protein
MRLLSGGCHTGFAGMATVVASEAGGIVFDPGALAEPSLRRIAVVKAMIAIMHAIAGHALVPIHAPGLFSLSRCFTRRVFTFVFLTRETI